MDTVKVISSTIQEYKGERYYKCGYYFQRKGKRLHRTVWEDHNGCIPEGYHIHHIDENTSNNLIDNLELVYGKDHIKKHSKDPSRMENGKKAIKIAIEKAPAWHHSDTGKEWHSKHAKNTWNNAEEKEYVCSQCGKRFMSRCNYSETWNRFCSLRCKAKFRRDSGIDDEIRICKYCNSEFKVNKYSKAKTCSRVCAGKMRFQS